MIRVLVVEDNVGFRSALVSLLEEQPDLEVAGTAGSLSEAHTMLEGASVVLLERRLRGGDTLEFIDALRSVNPDARVFVISSAEEATHPEDAMEAGADGVIDKMDTPERVFAAIREGGGG